ncbi:MAG: MerR family transcriptional regulator [Pseudomonadales bacterium]
MSHSTELYQIGAVAALTGIAVERLRAWERRHGFAPAQRNGRTRLYDARQVEKLRLMRALIDFGHPVSTLIDLSNTQLTARLGGSAAAMTAADQTMPATATAEQGHEPAPTRLVAPGATNTQLARPMRAPDAAALKVGLVGLNLLVLEQSAGALQYLAVMARWPTLDALLADLPAPGTLDALVIQQPVLISQRLDAIADRLPGTRLVCVYQFATERQRAAMESRQRPALSWPVSWIEIERTLTLGADSNPGAIAPRRFDDATLIALAASDQDPNQSARHLVELISSLNAYADYAAHCIESVGASTGQLYAETSQRVAAARALLEEALAGLADAEFR